MQLCFAAQSIHSLKEERKKLPQELINSTREQWGVAFAIQKKALPILEEVEPVNSRIIRAKLKGKIDINVLICYAPQAATMNHFKDHFWDTLKHETSKLPKHEFTIVLGDFNSKIWERQEDENCFGNNFLKGNWNNPRLARTEFFSELRGGFFCF